MIRVTCPAPLILETIAALRRGGARGEERVVLWLARAGAGCPVQVQEVYEPAQETARDRFKLPPESMRALMAHLASSRRSIVAQIHTHPGRAYHSEVDAEWAIVRHVGALSLVLPRFASTTEPDNFTDQVMTYECSIDGEWVLRPNVGPDAALDLPR